MQAIITYIVELFYFVTVIGIILVILLENRKPSKSIGWILVLVFIPIIGPLLYFIFGQDYRRLKRMLKKMGKGLTDFDSPVEKLEGHPEKIDAKYRDLSNLLTTINTAPILISNKIDFYSYGYNKFAQLFIDIENATNHVHLLYYKFADDKIGLALKDLLIKKVKQGIEVRVIYDDVGSIKTSKKFFQQMRNEGIEVATFLPIRTLRIVARVNYRNHRKLAIIDGTIGYVGGMNVADCYVEGISWGMWLDMHLRIEGNGVYGLQNTFIADWYYSAKIKLKNRLKYFPVIESKYSSHIALQTISSGPIDVYESISVGLFEAINSAKKYIYMQTPYFCPPSSIIDSMVIAAMKGVDVRIMLPSKSDSILVDAAAFSFIEELLVGKVKVYRYKAGFIHSKMFVVDDYITNVGSANMDARSLELNFETNVMIYNQEIALKAKNIFFTNAEKSEQVNIEEWESRSIWQRLFQSIMRLLSPLF